jgi:hypothetical protein
MKTIPIAIDESFTPPIPLPGLTRRDFLKGTGILSGTLVAGSTIALMAPSLAWAVELKTLSSETGQAVLMLARSIYPHAKLPDAVYALVAKDLDADAAKSADTKKMLEAGVADLNQRAGGNFARAPEAKRKEITKAVEGSPLFGAVRGKCVTSLYDNDMAYAHFGYPGSAWEKGGYILRGFNDLKWLPDPPLSASPAPYLG